MTCSSTATALLACLVPFACSGRRPETPRGSCQPPEKTMPASDQTTSARPIPPIDAAAPSNYQTATFALG